MNLGELVVKRKKNKQESGHVQRKKRICQRGELVVWLEQRIKTVLFTLQIK